MQNATPLKSFLEQLLPAALDLLREMVNLNSFTGNREGVNQVDRKSVV